MDACEHDGLLHCTGESIPSPPNPDPDRRNSMSDTISEELDDDLDTEFVPVKSADRALTLIEVLTEHNGGLTFTELQELIGWPRSSLYGLVRTMSERNHLSLDPRTQKYRIGVRIWEAGQAFKQGLDIADLAVPHLQAAKDRLGETVQLAVLDGVENVYIAKAEASHTLRLESFVGARLPAYATGIGKVLLAGLDEAELDRRLRYVKLKPHTATTITDMAILRNVIRETRERGFGIDNQEFTLGVCCFAVPVFDNSGRVIASMSASIPSVRISDGIEERALSVLGDTATQLSAQLGYRAES